MTAMTHAFRMTTLANGQAAFIGTGFMALDGTTQVLSGTPHSGQPRTPANAGFSSPRLRHSTVRSGWLDSKRDAHSDCQSHSKRLEESYPLSMRQTRVTEPLTAR